MSVNAAIFMKLMSAERIYMKIYTEFHQRSQETWKTQVEISYTFFMEPIYTKFGASLANFRK
jgi:hypothetical protein